MSKVVAVIFAFVALCILAFYAAVGIACLHMTKPAITEVNECDKTQVVDGKEWCMTLVKAIEPVGMTMPKPFGKAVTAKELQPAASYEELQ